MTSSDNTEDQDRSSDPGVVRHGGDLWRKLAPYFGIHMPSARGDETDDTSANE
jgi:hypothetical protein